jgi:hypothetical protein
MKLIPEWKKAWRMLSIQAMTIATALQGAWLSLPEDMKTGIDPRLINGACIALLALGIVGRLVKQDKVSGE